MSDTFKKKTKKPAKNSLSNGEMNPRLETLLNLINESKQWSSEEKNTAVQAVIDAEKELVQKSREIEVEAALEKVRAKALAMNDPSDMPEVCRTISDQLENLNVKNIRNVQTAIINQSKGTYFNYEYYAKHHRTFITEVDYNHPMTTGFINQMLKGPGEFFSRTLEGKELKDWYSYQKTTNQFADQYLESAKSLTYYWYSLGPVALGISTYSPLSDEEMDLFKRFRNVFELAYRRFIDIETAISQARESQIEAALERVRASALGMLKSNDVNDAVVVMFETLEKLEPGMLRCGVGILNKETRTADVWATSATDHGTVLKVTGNESIDIHPLLQGAFDAWLNQHDFSYELKGDDLIQYYSALTKTNFRLPEAQSIVEKAEAQLSSQPLQQFYYVAPFEAGNLFAFMETPFPDETKRVIRRFASAFNLTYKRFVDLQRAEERAREAQIEASLERVRAEAMAMHTTAELQKVGETIFHELKSLGFIDIRNAEIIINNDEKETVLSHFCDYGVTGTIEVDYKTNPILHNWATEMKKASDAFVSVVIPKKEMHAWRKFREELGYKPDPQLNAASSVYYYSYSTGLGALSISSFSPISDDQMKTLQRFRNVFTLAYRRYVDVAQAEAQAQEAQIELALERVRASAMSMKQASEMTEVCRIISEQLQQLGIEGIRNVQTAIIHEERGTYTKYEYFVQYNTTSVVEIEIKLHPVIEEFVNKILSNKDSFFAKTVGGKDLEILHSYRKSTHQNPDPILEKANAVHYYFYSIGPGALGICTFSPLGDKEINLFKRFKNVFELAYRRFLDIQKAEAQARETQIQLALERVRARTMAMQKSDELSETVYTLFQQFRELGENPDQATIGIVNEHDKVIEYWVTMYGNKENRVFKFSIDEPHVTNRIYKAWKEGKKSLVIDLSGKELYEFTKYRESMGGAKQNPEEKRRVINVAFFSKGLLNVQSNEARSEESIRLLERFASVFEQTYTRFLDLQKAEEQAHEAKIEAALERVRSRAMAMHKSDDLNPAVAIVFEELEKLNLGLLRCGIGIIKGEKRTVNVWSVAMSNRGTAVQVSGDESMDIHPLLQGAFDAWMKQGDFSYTLEGDGLVEYYRTIEKTNIKLPNSKRLASGKENLKHFYYVTSFSFGGLFAFSESEFSNETKLVMKRFAGVFDLTYKRFQDIQKAEAQAREAQIEASLERVRGRAMAMRTSNDLMDAAGTIFTELNKLGINPIRSGFVLLNKDSRRAKVYPATSFDESATLSFSGEFDFVGHPVFEKQYESWQKGENYFPVLEGEVLKSYYRILAQGLSVPYESFPTDIKQFGSFLPFTEGFLFTWSKEPYSEKEIGILTRFKSILDLTIRRYSDLQTAEAQAREAQIEAGLERVRSRTLAMQSSDELAETAAVVFKQLMLLGIEPNRLYISIMKDDIGHTEFWITDEDGSKVSFAYTADMLENPTFKKMFEGWKEKKKSITIDMYGKELEEYFKYLTSLKVPFKGGLSQTHRVQTIAYFSQGFIGIASPDAQPQETTQLLERFAYVFNLTFTRFNDLQVAEEQARKAIIEEQKLREEKKRADDLLLNILPEEIAAELKQFGKSYARKYDQVTILFADIKGFSSIAEKLSAQELVTQLDECFRAFDHIVDKHGLEKIKTVGDAYVCACGLPKPVPDNAVRAVRAAIDMMSFIKGFSITRTIQDLPAFEFRIGIHTGPVVTGVVGLKKFTYDIWGDAVNMAARMEQHGEAGKINISESTYELVKDKFTCVSRGKVAAKNKGDVEMYFVE